MPCLRSLAHIFQPSGCPNGNSFVAGRHTGCIALRICWAMGSRVTLGANRLDHCACPALEPASCRPSALSCAPVGRRGDKTCHQHRPTSHGYFLVFHRLLPICSDQVILDSLINFLMSIHARKRWVISCPAWNAVARSCKSQRCSQQHRPWLRCGWHRLFARLAPS